MARAREAARRSSCQNNLKQFGIIFKMYANESKGERWPKLQDEANTAVTGMALPSTVPSFNPDALEIYPEYCTDLNVFICPSDTEAGQTLEELGWFAGAVPPAGFVTGDFIAYSTPGVAGGSGFNASGDASYVYFGLAVDGDNELFEGWTGGTPDPDTPVYGWTAELLASMLVWKAGGTDNDMNYRTDGLTGAGLGLGSATNANPNLNGTILRLREGIERFFITDINNAAGSAVAQSNLPVMWDSYSTDPGDSNHIPGGSNVLYADGHVGFIKYSSQLGGGVFPGREWAEITEMGA
ncbi:MAG: DUF1559 domain-containing protein [Candidatus Hydrogenedentes bacterium]|nr:DUF1559 domain-containing protein [Candidatus Hydrogenedentota bacterium]